MKLIMDVKTDDEWLGNYIDVAQVELSKERAEKILLMAKTVKVLEVYKISKFDWTPDFFSMDQDTGQLQESNVGVECVTLEVSDEWLWWRGYYKHTSSAWETTRVPVELLFGEEMVIDLREGE